MPFLSDQQQLEILRKKLEKTDQETDHQQTRRIVGLCRGHIRFFITQVHKYVAFKRFGSSFNQLEFLWKGLRKNLEKRGLPMNVTYEKAFDDMHNFLEHDFGRLYKADQMMGQALMATHLLLFELAISNACQLKWAKTLYSDQPWWDDSLIGHSLLIPIPPRAQTEDHVRHWRPMLRSSEMATVTDVPATFNLGLLPRETMEKYSRRLCGIVRAEIASFIHACEACLDRPHPARQLKDKFDHFVPVWDVLVSHMRQDRQTTRHLQTFSDDLKYFVRRDLAQFFETSPESCSKSLSNMLWALDDDICQSCQNQWSPHLYSDQPWWNDVSTATPELIPIPTPSITQEEPPVPRSTSRAPTVVRQSQGEKGPGEARQLAGLLLSEIAIFNRNVIRKNLSDEDLEQQLEAVSGRFMDLQLSLERRGYACRNRSRNYKGYEKLKLFVLKGIKEFNREFDPEPSKKELDRHLKSFQDEICYLIQNKWAHAFYSDAPWWNDSVLEQPDLIPLPTATPTQQGIPSLRTEPTFYRSLFKKKPSAEAHGLPSQSSATQGMNPKVQQLFASTGGQKISLQSAEQPQPYASSVQPQAPQFAPHIQPQAPQYALPTQPQPATDYYYIQPQQQPDVCDPAIVMQDESKKYTAAALLAQDESEPSYADPLGPVYFDVPQPSYASPPVYLDGSQYSYAAIPVYIDGSQNGYAPQPAYSDESQVTDYSFVQDGSQYGYAASPVYPVDSHHSDQDVVQGVSQLNIDAEPISPGDSQLNVDAEPFTPANTRQN